VWLYVRTVDDNFAFHVHRRLLSLACCKGATVRAKAQQNDVVIALTSVENREPLRVSGIFRVNDSIPRQQYYDCFSSGYGGLDARHGRTGRVDNIYNRDRLLINNYHHPCNYASGVLKDMRSDLVLL